MGGRLVCGSFRDHPFVLRRLQAVLAVGHIPTPYTLLAHVLWSRQSVKATGGDPAISADPGLRPCRRGRPPGAISFSPPPGRTKTRPWVNVGTSSLAPPPLPGLLGKILAAQRRNPARPDQLLSLLANWRPSRGPQDGRSRRCFGAMAQGCAGPACRSRRRFSGLLNPTGPGPPERRLTGPGTHRLEQHLSFA